MSTNAKKHAPITVVKIGGAAIDRAHELGALWHGLCALHATLTRSGGGVVLVHGGGAMVDARTRAAGLEPVKHDGVRITDDEQLGIVVGVLAGEVNTQLCGLLGDAGAPVIGLTLESAGLRCARATGLGFDAGRVGEVVGDAGGDRLRTLVGLGLLPVVSSIGHEVAAGALNVNADDAAGGVASAIDAEQLVLLTDVPGVNDADGNVIALLDQHEIESLVGSGVIAGGMVPKTRAALAASAKAGAPAIIASWQDETVFDRLAAGQDVGTRVMSERAKQEAASA